MLAKTHAGNAGTNDSLFALKRSNSKETAAKPVHISWIFKLREDG